MPVLWVVYSNTLNLVADISAKTKVQEWVLTGCNFQERLLSSPVCHIIIISRGFFLEFMQIEVTTWDAHCSFEFEQDITPITKQMIGISPNPKLSYLEKYSCYSCSKYLPNPTQVKLTMRDLPKLFAISTWKRSLYQ
jgi:hypothetical protein